MFFLLIKMFIDFCQMLRKKEKEKINRQKTTCEQQIVENSEGSGARRDIGCDVADGFGHLGIDPHQILDFADGTQRRGMVAAELLADIRQG